ncbi:PREDICTED: aspartic proteinase-like protein 1 [Erythranthe guttata]|uniref:aspartic proteinase-like protein 1 n=1 Tax=Erythranthe guttata TaxID=4155 RepID=UPI00064DDED9|nr:PREDICTED: aspartic proteinase-like protein 1 [Erythranthe guttata]|eukprot:XP_012837909.1 PREDICTED: aspartic proteinase-like protein 1 [Erythranthe guttata]
MCFRKSVFGSCLILIAFACWFNAKSGEAFGTFGFDIHHRYSDTVKEFLNLDGLPEKGTVDYYSAMAHRDHLFKGRRLATTTTDSQPITFFGGNETYRISSLGFLHYSFVTVGTPPVEYLVALDTGSDLFWLPCDCTTTCLRSFNISSEETLKLNIYSPSTSTSSVPVPCNSTICVRPQRGCSVRLNACAYQELYLSANTSTTGILVDDVLHLGTDTDPQEPIDAPITLGCGIIQTGAFVDGAAINGLFGLGMDAAMDLDEFNLEIKEAQTNNPSYNVTVTQIVVGENETDIDFSALFDTGTSFAYLNDPAYSVIVQGFDSQIIEPRYVPPRRIIFDYCYSLSATQKSYSIPRLNLIMKGGGQFFVKAPTFVIPREGGYAYCLAIVKSEDINIIGQNFMTGYRLVFDREEMVLGWKEANCYESISSNSTPPINKGSPVKSPPPSVFTPEATHDSSPPPPPPSPTTTTRPLFGNGSGVAARLSSVTTGLVMVLLATLALV